MIEQLDISLRNANWNKILRFLLLSALFLPLVATTSSADAAPRVQQVLLDMAAQRPDAHISIIVQKLVHDDSVEQTVVQLGGTVTKDLRIINAFAADISAKQVSQ